MLEYARLCYTLSCNVALGNPMLHYVTQSHAMLCCPCDSMLCSATLCTFMLHLARLCYVMQQDVLHLLSIAPPDNAVQNSFALNCGTVPYVPCICRATAALCHALLNPSHPMPAQRWSPLTHQCTFVHADVINRAQVNP